MPSVIKVVTAPSPISDAAHDKHGDIIWLGHATGSSRRWQNMARSGTWLSVPLPKLDATDGDQRGDTMRTGDSTGDQGGDKHQTCVATVDQHGDNTWSSGAACDQHLRDTCSDSAGDQLGANTWLGDTSGEQWRDEVGLGDTTGDQPYSSRPAWNCSL